jgi:hypothetical protein
MESEEIQENFYVKPVCSSGHCRKIEVEYLVIRNDRMEEENYCDNFMMELKSKVCCEQATFPFYYEQHSDGTIVAYNKKGFPLTLSDIQEQVSTIRKMCEIKKRISRIKFDPTKYDD